MEFLKYFNSYLNESEGFGNSYFQVKKMDKAYYYFFKIGDQSDKERGFIIKAGKFSKNNVISAAESSYAVLSIEEMDPNDMDAYLVNESPYKSKEDDKFTLTNDELNKIYQILGKIWDDYLQKNPKVVNIYDEFLENLDMDKKEYLNFSSNNISIWTKGRWKPQNSGDSGDILYTKSSHS